MENDNYDRMDSMMGPRKTNYQRKYDYIDVILLSLSTIASAPTMTHVLTLNNLECIRDPRDHTILQQKNQGEIQEKAHIIIRKVDLGVSKFTNPSNQTTIQVM